MEFQYFSLADLEKRWNRGPSAVWQTIVMNELPVCYWYKGRFSYEEPPAAAGADGALIEDHYEGLVALRDPLTISPDKAFFEILEAVSLPNPVRILPRKGDPFSDYLDGEQIIVLRTTTIASDEGRHRIGVPAASALEFEQSHGITPATDDVYEQLRKMKSKLDDLRAENQRLALLSETQTDLKLEPVDLADYRNMALGLLVSDIREFCKKHKKNFNTNALMWTKEQVLRELHRRHKRGFSITPKTFEDFWKEQQICKINSVSSRPARDLYSQMDDDGALG